MQLCFKKLQAFSVSKHNIPPTVGVLGYGAIGKAFIEILLKNHPRTNVVALDKLDLFNKGEKRFATKVLKVTKENVHTIPQTMGLNQQDFLVDLSTNIEFLSLWPHCVQNNIKYMNTALEQWEDGEDASSHPTSAEEAYKLSLGYIKDQAMAKPIWKQENGPTTLLEMGYNPGVVSSCVKRGLEDCAKYHLKKKTQGFDLHKLKEALQSQNHSQLAQILGVHTIHCSETDKQVLDKTPADVKTKFYNTWSCRGFLTEGMVPIQVARGSHEDETLPDCYTVRDGKTLISKKPSVQTKAKSWVPCEDITGVLIPHGEAYSIQDYLRDPVTGYAPSQYYVYNYCDYAKKFINNLPPNADVHNTNPVTEVIHPMNHPSLRGVDKVGALLIMKNNRGWWTGSIMDEIDSKMHFDGKFGPTVLQVAAGVYAGFLWACQNPNSGCKFADQIDADFVIDQCLPYLGRFVSTHVDLGQTKIKDCYKLQSFLVE